MKRLIDNLDEEVRSGHLVTAQMKRIWNIELNLADKLLEVCNKHNLRIWAGAGTALGAVRHKGFIPWDDDMDFMMLRKDYDILCKIAPKEFKSPFFFQTYEDKGFGGGFAKLRYDGTIMLTDWENYLPPFGHLGIFVDIFVQDALPKDKTEIQKMVSLKETVLNYITIRDNWKYLYLPDRLLMLLKGGIKLGKKAFWSNKKLMNYFEDKVRSYKVEDSGVVAAYTYEYFPRCIRPIEWFDNTIYMKFEKIEIPLIGDYHKALTNDYGDYMTPKKDAGMHNTPFVSDEMDYREYVKNRKLDIWRLYKDSFRNIYHQVKNISKLS